MSLPLTSSALVLAVDLYAPSQRGGVPRMEIGFICTGPLQGDVKQQAFLLRQQADALDPPKGERQPTFHLPE